MDLEKRNQDLYALIQLLATYGPSTMSEKELIEVTKAYECCHRAFVKPSGLAVTHLLFGLSGSEAIRESMMRSGGELVSLGNTATLVGTSFLEGYFLKSYMEYRKELKEEFELIQKFKQSRIRTREAYEHLKELLCCYQEEYESNSRKIKEIKEKKK